MVVSACADVFGRNSHTPRWWSREDSCLRHHWGGMFVWCNPPFSLIIDVLVHFLRCKREVPMGTPLLLLVPVWVGAAWRSHILAMPRTFRRVRRWARGTPLFTAPPREMPALARSYVGSAPFAVEVYHVSGAPMSEQIPASLRESVGL